MSSTDKNIDIIFDKYPAKKVETYRSGLFTFQVGVDFNAVEMLGQRVHDAQLRFRSVPTLPNIIAQFHEEVLVSSIYGTNTIEGGTLTFEETKAVLGSQKEAREEKEIRVKNIKSAYDKAVDYAEHILSENKPLIIHEFILTDLHELITDQLTDEPRNLPGRYRDNRKGELTKIGSQKHGGTYVPPKCYDDIKLLVDTFLEWINCDEILQLPPTIRAPLAHYYFERIHPFWDGNGRVGRVLEAMILRGSDFKYAPFAMAKFYLEHIDEYFTKFNEARIAEEKKQKFPNTCFVYFFLNGLLEVINRLHDRINAMIAFLLYENKVNTLLQSKQINTRQFTILNNLLPYGPVHKLKEIQSKIWYKGLYVGLTERTQYRDIKKLTELNLIDISPDKNIRLLIERGWD